MMNMKSSITNSIPSVKNFTYSEFSCPCRICEYGSGRDIDPILPLIAQEIRNALDRPLKVNSACRCGPHNSTVGGSLNSQHLDKNGFKAMDLDIKHSWERAKAIEIALDRGASVGLNKDFLHIDVREGKPIIFLY